MKQKAKIGMIKASIAKQVIKQPDGTYGYALDVGKRQKIFLFSPIPVKSIQIYFESEKKKATKGREKKKRDI